MCANASLCVFTMMAKTARPCVFRTSTWDRFFEAESGEGICIGTL